MSDQAAPVAESGPALHIEHVIVLMLENRSFEHIFAFAGLPDCGKPTHPRPDEETSLPPPNATAKRVVPLDGPHSHGSVMKAMARQGDVAEMTGFADAYVDKAAGKAPALAGPLSMRLNFLAAATGAAAIWQLAWPCAVAVWLGLVVVLLIVFVSLSVGWLDGRNTILRWAFGKWGKWLPVLLALPVLAAVAAWRATSDEPIVRAVAGATLGLAAIGCAFAARAVRKQGGPDLVATHKKEVFLEAALSAHQRTTIAPLADLASAYGVCARWHCSIPGETWPNRNFAVAGTSDGAVDIEYRLFTDRTIFESLEDNYTGSAPPWRVYFGDIPQVLAFKRLWQHRGPKAYKEVFQPNSALLALLAEEDPVLPAFSFVEPHHHNGTILPGGSGGSSSQHPNNNRVPPDIYQQTQLDDDTDRRYGSDFDRGIGLAVDIYEALRSNPSVFEKTLYVITYDEHGGCYDRVAPTTATLPPKRRQRRHRARLRTLRGLMGLTGSFDFTMLGPRIPGIVISPWITAGTCYCEQVDHSTIPRTVRAVFGIDEPLSGPGATDREAMSPSLLPMLGNTLRPPDDWPVIEFTAPIRRDPPPRTGSGPGGVPSLDPMAAGLLPLGLTVGRTVSQQADAEAQIPEPELVSMGADDDAGVTPPAPELEPTAGLALRRAVVRAGARRDARKATAAAAAGDLVTFEDEYAKAVALLRDPERVSW